MFAPLAPPIFQIQAPAVIPQLNSPELGRALFAILGPGEPQPDFRLRVGTLKGYNVSTKVHENSLSKLQGCDCGFIFTGNRGAVVVFVVSVALTSMIVKSDMSSKVNFCFCSILSSNTVKALLGAVGFYRVSEVL